jgi:hypothetical protein
MTSRRRAGFWIALTGGVLLVLSLSVMEWVRFGSISGGSPRRAYGLKFLQVGDRLAIVHVGFAEAYFGGLALVLAALALILTFVATRRRSAVRWFAVLVTLVAAVLQIAVMASVENTAGTAGPGFGSYVGLLGYVLLAVGAVIGPASQDG